MCVPMLPYYFLSMFFSLPCLLIVGHSFQPSFQDIPRAPTTKMNPSQLDISGSKRLQKRPRRPRLRNAEECGSIPQVETVYVPSPKCVFLGTLFYIAMEHRHLQLDLRGKHRLYIILYINWPCCIAAIAMLNYTSNCHKWPKVEICWDQVFFPKSLWAWVGVWLEYQILLFGDSKNMEKTYPKQVWIAAFTTLGLGFGSYLLGL